MNTEAKDKSLIYSRSGCSNVPQLANDLAVILDREGSAKISCIAWVGLRQSNWQRLRSLADRFWQQTAVHLTV